MNKMPMERITVPGNLNGIPTKKRKARSTMINAMRGSHLDTPKYWINIAAVRAIKKPAINPAK